MRALFNKIVDLFKGEKVEYKTIYSICSMADGELCTYCYGEYKQKNEDVEV